MKKINVCFWLTHEKFYKDDLNIIFIMLKFNSKHYFNIYIYSEYVKQNDITKQLNLKGVNNFEINILRPHKNEWKIFSTRWDERIMYKLDTLVDCPECDKILCIDTDVIVGTDIWDFYNQKVNKNIYFTLTDNAENLDKSRPPYQPLIKHPNWGFGVIHLSNIKDRKKVWKEMHEVSYLSSTINPEEMLVRLNYYKNIKFQSKWGIFYILLNKNDKLRKIAITSKVFNPKDNYYVVHYVGGGKKLLLKNVNKILYAFKHKGYRKFVKNVNWKQID